MARIRLLSVVVPVLLALGVFGCGGSNSSTTPPATGSGAIEGYVFGRTADRSRAATRQATAPDGTVALNGATVTVTPAAGGTSRQATTSGDRGNPGFFRMLDLDAGNYNVTVSCQNYVDATYTVAVKAGDTTLAGTNNGQTVLEPVGAAPQRKWTVMVYLDADCDLEEYGILNMNQMESIGSDANVNMVVQFDRGPSYDQTNGDWEDTRRYLVTKDSNMQQITSPVLQNMGEVDMGDPAQLTSFITWAKAQYPADRYCLILWNHGAGWRSRAAAQQPPASRGIIFDDTTGTALTMGRLNQGIANSNVHFDLIAVDCSLMGMVEVYYELRQRADYIVASEESPPGTGYPYAEIMGRLAANASMGPETFGRAFVEEHIAAYPDARDAVTQSLIQTSRMSDFCVKVNDFAAALLPLVSTNRSQLDAARLASQSYAYSFYRDLYDFASNVKATITDPAAVSAADALMNSLAAASGGPLVAEGHSTTGVGRSHGISIHLPAPSQYAYTNSALPETDVAGVESTYADLQFVKDYPKWQQYLAAMASR